MFQGLPNDRVKVLDAPKGLAPYYQACPKVLDIERGESGERQMAESMGKI